MGVLYRLILAISLLLCLDLFPAFSVDFMTKAQFESEENPYKNYPLKILFKKLNESDLPEKKEIRNVIILKQAFDRNMQEKVKAGIIQYEKIYNEEKHILEKIRNLAINTNINTSYLVKFIIYLMGQKHAYISTHQRKKINLAKMLRITLHTIRHF